MITALIPARSGSKRVPNKNIKDFFGFPLIAYSIAYARNSSLIRDILVSTDSQEIGEIASKFGVTDVILRPQEISSEQSLDIEWIEHIDSVKQIKSEYAAIIRPTSPLRSQLLLSDMWNLLRKSKCDSIRTVKRVKEHPGKMWRLEEDGEIKPLLNQLAGQTATHAMQYASLPTIFVQTSVLEVFKVESMRETRTREGNRICGYPTSGLDSWAIDETEDWNAHIYAVEKNGELKSTLNSMFHGINE